MMKYNASKEGLNLQVAQRLPRLGTASRIILDAIVLFWLLMVSQGSTAAQWFVRSGATGSNSGTDWNNAWTGMAGIVWDSVKPGDTVWIAGGSYGALEPKKSGISGSPIYIVRARATNALATAAPGWMPGFDSTVTINTVRADYSASYWVLDGQIPHGGIIVTNTALVGHVINFSTKPAREVVLKNLLISGAAINQSMPGLGDNRCINANFFASPGSGLTVTDCTLQHAPTLASICYWNNVTIQRCKFWRNFAGSSGYHPNIMQNVGCTNLVFRWNECTEWLAEGIMMDFASSSDAPNDNWDIYANLWHDAYPSWYGRILESQYRAQYRIRFFNNTVVNSHFGVMTSNGGSWDPSCSSSNNISFGIAGYETEFPGGKNGNNLSDSTLSSPGSISSATSSIFANYAAKDYRINSSIAAGYPREKGVNLGSAYSIDYAGNLRSGAWDIGAYEYGAGSGTPSDTIAPTISLTSPAPGNTMSDLHTLSAHATDNPDGLGIVLVVFEIDGKVVSSNKTAPYTFSWDSSSVTNGAHSARARAWDGAGNEGTSSSVSFTVVNDKTPPLVRIVSPSSGSFVSNLVTIAAEASDTGHAVRQVSFLVNGNVISTVSNSPYEIVWNSGLVTNGTYTAQASAFDTAGNQATSVGIPFHVNNPVTPPPSNGIVGLWKFDEGQGILAADSGSQGNHAILQTGAAWGAGLTGSALLFVGSNGYARVQSSEKLEQVKEAFTISAVVKIDKAESMQTILRKVLSETTNTYPYSAYDIIVEDRGTSFAPRIGVSSSLTSRTVVYGASHSYGAWYHIAGVYDGTSVAIYVNGVLEGTTSHKGAVLQTPGPLCIGRYGLVTESVNGLIDEVTIHNRPLTSSEIRKLIPARVLPPSRLKIVPK